MQHSLFISSTHPSIVHWHLRHSKRATVKLQRCWYQLHGWTRAKNPNALLPMHYPAKKEKMIERTGKGKSQRQHGTVLMCARNRCSLCQLSCKPSLEMASAQFEWDCTHSNHKLQRTWNNSRCMLWAITSNSWDSLRPLTKAMSAATLSTYQTPDVCRNRAGKHSRP